tara:strand:- start:259 stop:438 length:180 start_codon:yes stop_codon:yes gene_type:complete
MAQLPDPFNVNTQSLVGKLCRKEESYIFITMALVKRRVFGGTRLGDGNVGEPPTAAVAG